MYPEEKEKAESNAILYRKPFFSIKSVILIIELWKKGELKMKYYLFDTAPWEIFYDISARTDAEAIRSFVHAYPGIYSHMEKFDQKLHRPAGHTSAISDGSSLYVLYTKAGELELWQAGNRVSDITGYIIPGAYHIRRIGTFIPDEPDIAAKKGHSGEN